MTEPQSIIIIGAGSSGLAAGHQLHSSYPNTSITILEASLQYGGRVKQDTGLFTTDYTIEQGGEFLHNYNSWYGEQLRKMEDIELIDYLDKDLYYQDPVTNELIANTGSKFEQRFTVHLQSLAKFYYEKSHNPAISDMSVSQILEQSFTEIDQGTKYLYEGIIGNIQGSTNDNISAYGYIKIFEEYQPYYIPSDFDITKYGVQYQIKGKTQKQILGELFADILPFIQYNSAVKKIEYNRDQVVVTTSTGQVYKAEKIVICVPITQLKENKIIFEPALSQEKLDAIEAIKMDNGVKLHLKFSEKFWSGETFGILIKGNVNLIWDSSSAKSDSEYILSTLFFGENAVYFDCNIEQVIEEILFNLSLSYNQNINDLFEDYNYLNWGQQQFIEGAYSYTGLEEGNARQVIRESVDDKLYFAGEHTNPFDFATINGAIESGFYAAQQIAINNKEQQINKVHNK